jgi:hypothetical protein
MMAIAGRYLYGLIRATEDRDFGPVGLPIVGAPTPVHTIRVGDIGAVVSNLPTKDRLLPLRRNLEPHNRVIRDIMNETTIIPMAFGQVARTEAEVVKALKGNLKTIDAELARLDGKVEMTLRVLWDVPNIFEYLVAEDPVLALARDEMFGRSSRPTQAEMIDMGKMFEERLAFARKRDTRRLVQIFKPHAAEVKENDPKDEKMVAHLSFLVRRDQMQTFEETLFQAASGFPDAYVFDYNGPWAPFSFVELDLRLDSAQA